MEAQWYHNDGVAGSTVGLVNTNSQPVVEVIVENTPEPRLLIETLQESRYSTSSKSYVHSGQSCRLRAKVNRGSIWSWREWRC